MAAATPGLPLVGNLAGRELDLSEAIELLVLGAYADRAVCRLLDTGEVLDLRAVRVSELVPGEVITVAGENVAGGPEGRTLSGAVTSSRLDLRAAELPLLALESFWDWDPADHYWGEEDEPIPAWAEPIIRAGVRPCFEMQQIRPGRDPRSGSDLIYAALDLRRAGDPRAARALLMDALVLDVRALDAHANLGYFLFDRDPERCARHCEVGVRIGEQALGPGFEGVLPWGLIDNRGFLRCLHGLALCLWRLGRGDEAGGVLVRMLALNPTDNQGARFLLPAVRRGATWTPDGPLDEGGS
jgi:hypothetical protein